VLTERFEGRRYNAPNDVCVDRHGRIWFTDPYYWTELDSLEMGCEAVYCIDAGPGNDGPGKDHSVRRVLSQPDIGRPNGLAITPDAKTLYVVDSHNVAGGNRKIWAFDVAPDGTLAHQRLVFDFGRGRGGDGMRLDSQGNLWVAAGVMKIRNPHETTEVPTGVYVISPAGKLLGRIPIPEDVITNLTFAGPDLKTLYVTAGKTLFKIETQVAGYSLYPGAPGK
jgi:gluconolactonase